MNALQPKTFKQWHRIKRLHAAAFTGSERKSLSIHRIRQEEGKADIWYFEENNTFIGYAIATPGRDKVLINYLAVTPSMRGQNLGSIILKKLQQQYAGKGLFAEVDIIPEGYPDKHRKFLRKQFYLKAGMKELGVLASYYETHLELVGIDCEMTFESYFQFYAETYNMYTASGLRPYKKPAGPENVTY